MRSLRERILVAALLLVPRLGWARPERLSLELGGGAPPIALVLVRGGTFTQGSPSTEKGRKDDEAQREVTLTRDLYVAETPVQRGQYARFVAATGYRTEAERGKSGGYGLEAGKLVQRPGYTWRAPGFEQSDAHPAALLTWGDAVAFTEWASRVTGRRVRLPTEAEWEHACRAGTSTPWYGGFAPDDAKAIGWFNVAGAGTHPVREKRPNGLQLHDLVGNVWQWTADLYGPYGAGPVSDPGGSAIDRNAPTAPGAGEPPRRVIRGGSFLSPVAAGRCAARARSSPGTRNADIGFRVVVDDADEGAGLAPPQQGTTQRAAGPAPSSGAGGDGLGLLSVLGGALAAVGGLYALVRRGRRRGAGAREAAPALSSVRAASAEDGLRLYAPPQAAGEQVRVRFRVGGVEREQTVRLEPSMAGQFVYTGGRPEQIVVLAALEAATAEAVRAAVAPTPPAPPEPSPEPPSSFSSGARRGWPPAY